MCVTSRLQQHIRNLTNDGEVVARFLVDTVQGNTPGAKPCHQLEAMKHLIRFGFTDDTNRHSRAGGNPEGQGEGRSHFWGLIPTPEELAAEKNTPSPSMGEGWDGGDESPLPLRGRVREGASPPSMSESVTHLDILNYDIAHLIRTETADGHTIAEFLSDVMTRRDKPFTPKKLRIRHTDRMAAAREILRRGFGHFGRKRKLVADDHDANIITTPTTTTPCTPTSPSECESTPSTAQTQSASSSTSWKTPTPTSHTPGTTACQQPTSYSAAAGTPTTTTSPPRCSKTTGATSTPPQDPPIRQRTIPPKVPSP